MLALSLAGVSSASDPAPPQLLPAVPPAVPHTCRVVLQGAAPSTITPGDGKGTAAAAGVRSLLHCWDQDSRECPKAELAQQQGQPQGTADTQSQQAKLTAWVGAALYNALKAPTDVTHGTVAEDDWPQLSVCGVELRLRTQHTADNSTHLPASPSPHGNTPMVIDPSAPGGLDDWGVTLRGVPHLVLVDSVLTHLPLSSIGPLLQCDGCERLTVRNLTMQHLWGPGQGGGGGEGGSAPPEAVAAPPDPNAAAPPGPVYGAFGASGLRHVEAYQVHCSNVKKAHGWACMLLQYARVGEGGGGSASSLDEEANGGEGGESGSGSFLLDGGTFINNTVVRAGPVKGVEGLGQLGYGAVVLGADEGAPLAPGPHAPPGAPPAAAGGLQQPPAAPSPGSDASTGMPSVDGLEAPPGASVDAPALPAAADPRTPLGRVELRRVAVEGNSGGSGAVLAVVDLAVVSGAVLAVVDLAMVSGAVLAVVDLAVVSRAGWGGVHGGGGGDTRWWSMNACVSACRTYSTGSLRWTWPW